MLYDTGYVQSSIAIQGKCQVVVFADTFFGGTESKTYRSKVLTNPTWKTLFGCAKRSVNKTNDTHHMFFENVHYRHTAFDAKHGDVKVYEISLGS
jgi:hypothetical protein